MDEDEVPALLMSGPDDFGVEKEARGSVHSLVGEVVDGNSDEEGDEDGEESEEGGDEGDGETGNEGVDEKVGEKKEKNVAGRLGVDVEGSVSVREMVNEWEQLIDEWTQDEAENTKGEESTGDEASGEERAGMNSKTRDVSEEAPLMTWEEALMTWKEVEEEEEAVSEDINAEILRQNEPKTVDREEKTGDEENGKEMRYEQGTIEWEMVRRKRLKSIRLRLHPAVDSKVVTTEVPKETTAEVLRQNGSEEKLHRPPSSVKPPSDHPRPRYVFKGQRPVRSLPRISEDIAWDPTEHEIEERVRYSRLTTSSMVTLRAHSGISVQSSTVVEDEETIERIEKKGSRLSYLIKAIKGKLVARRVMNKELSARAAHTKARESSSSSTTIGEAEQEPGDKNPVERELEPADIHELVNQCKVYIIEITSEKMREAEAQTKVVLEAVEKYRLEGKSLLAKP